MDNVHVTLTVCFEAPFWRGIFERTCDGTLSACRITFGVEPKDQEILDFIAGGYFGLCFTPPTAQDLRQRADSPKRRQRNAAREVKGTGVGTRSQQLLQAQREAAAAERTRYVRERREEVNERRYELRHKKRKEKHRGH